jgi:hypothetical protein
MPDTKVVGSAGEHFVCSVLAQLGWAAALTREGVAHADVLAVRASAERQMIEVQVKTKSWNRRPKWPMGHWMEPSASNRQWYVFVLLAPDPGERPTCFVVPHDHVTAGTHLGHQAWRTDPAVPAGKRNTPLTRTMAGIDLWERYKEAWELLEKPADEAQIRLPMWLRPLIDEPRIEFPNWHPWRESGIPDWMPE